MKMGHGDDEEKKGGTRGAVAGRAGDEHHEGGHLGRERGSSGEDELTNSATSSSSSSASSSSSSSDNSSSSCSPTRIGGAQKRPRKCAELANKRIKRNTDQPVGGQDRSRPGALKGCEKSDCKLGRNCVLQVSAQCAISEGPPVHISRREHICQQCYEEFRVGKPLFARYIGWKKRWISHSRCVPRLRMFIFEELLPYWLNCAECGKFRRISRCAHSSDSTLSASIVAAFRCSYAFPEDFEGDPCSVPEDPEVIDVRSDPTAFIKSLTVPPLLQNSPAIHFLEDEYYYDELALSPTNRQFEAKACKSAQFMCPFNIPDQPSKAFSLRPDVLEYDEVFAFPELAVDHLLYLAMRNLVVALWSLDPFDHLDYKKCLTHLICPGLARVWYGIELRRVLDYLSMKSVVNYGVLSMPKETLISRKKVQKPEVVVVGGGISGLAAARQLRSLGAKVTLLEAKAKLGGRMQDDWSLGVAVGCGAQLVTGMVNNPILLMCEQIGLNYRLLSDECPLVDAQNGKLVSKVADRVVDEHFNCLLDVIGHWKEEGAVEDDSLLSQLNGIHEELLRHMDFRWAKDFERLFQWQIGNVEFSCGAKLSEVSAKEWDQNESVGQFAGAHALMSEGSGGLIRRLAEGTDIRSGYQVAEIEWNGADQDQQSDRSGRSRKRKKKVLIRCTNGKVISCDKVLLCVPLTQYQKGQIRFVPALPLTKQLAYQSLGSGLIEKVAVEFPRRFWASLLKNDGTLDYFGHVPKCPEERGLFNIFYDFSTRPSAKRQQQHFVLMSYFCGDSIPLLINKTDVEIVEQFVETLRALFPDENVPVPTGFVVTHWSRDPLIGMSYSYVKVGGSGKDYDELAKSVDGQLYFGGECTNRFFPQTMTGAYISALRESSKIVEDWLRSCGV